jgi:hypothetical protein
MTTTGVRPDRKGQMQGPMHEGGRGAAVGPGRWSRMAMVAVAAAVALAGAGCGGDDEPAPSRPIQSGPATTSSGAGAAPRIPAPGPLAPGTYETVKFRPKLSFRVGEGWGLLGDAENGIALAPKFDPATGPEKQITITAVKWVFDKPLLTDRELDANRERHILPAPRNLLRWLQANPHLQIGAAKPARLGGVRGVQFAVTVKKIPGPSNCQQLAPRHCVTLFPVTRGSEEPIEVVEVSGSPSRYILVEVDGQPVLVTVGAPPGQFSAFLAEAGKVLETVSFA